MNPNTLRRVQDLDARIATLRDEQRQSGALLERDPALERARQRADASAAAQRGAEEALTSLDKELRSVSERARSMHRRLYGGSVRNPQELLELQHELETLTARVAQLEERALSAMEDAEQAANTAADDASALQREEHERTERLGPLQQRLQTLKEALDTATGERDRAFSQLTAAEQSLYARVAVKHRPAVVSIAGDVCGGCHLPLSIEERRSVRSGERVVQCSNCDRILVP